MHFRKSLRVARRFRLRPISRSTLSRETLAGTVINIFARLESTDAGQQEILRRGTEFCQHAACFTQEHPTPDTNRCGMRVQTFHVGPLKCRNMLQVMQGCRSGIGDPSKTAITSS